MDKYRIGDMVEWTSSSAGVTKKKQGIVVAIVGPNRKPCAALSKKELDGYTQGPVRAAFKFSVTRDHESFLVSVEGGPKRKPQLYWPLVSALGLVATEAQLKSARRRLIEDFLNDEE